MIEARRQVNQSLCEYLPWLHIFQAPPQVAATFACINGARFTNRAVNV
jgi:hypothetical protein